MSFISKYLGVNDKTLLTGDVLWVIKWRMVIGTRIRQLRESKSLSQGDVEKRTGLLRCYISRVENGHTVPSVETIEKLAGAFEIPLYRFFYEGTEAPKISTPIDRSGKVELNGSSRDAKYIRSLQRCFAKMTASNRATFLTLARKMAKPPKKKA